MSKHERDGLMECLFSRPDMKLRNIKFFRGDRDVITEDEFRAQILCIAEQKKAGTATRSTSPTHSDLRPLDVRAYVASM